MKTKPGAGKMKWKKVSEGLKSMFDEVLPDDPRVERRKMFGCPCAFINGNMFAGLHQDNMMLRLPEPERARFLKEFQTTLFEPMPGRAMKEYVVVPGELFDEMDDLKKWIMISLDYVSKLQRKMPGKKA